MVIRYCKNCDAQLEKQHGFSRYLPYWYCRGCGEMLINPDIDMHDRQYPDVLWFCSDCGDLLNVQAEFEDDCGSWVCVSCGCKNSLTEEEIL